MSIIITVTSTFNFMSKACRAAIGTFFESKIQTYYCR